MTKLRLLDTADRVPPAWATVRGRPRVTAVRLGATLPGTAYRIERWLGEGGMGVVYEAEHVELGRRVALKILRPEYSGDAEASDRFASEARAVCQAASGFVVQVYDFARLPDGRAVFTMELLGGRTLLDEVAAGPVEPARAIGLLRQVCKALAAAHDAGIVHRDVKPANVALVGRPGERDSVRLLDFGIHAIVDRTNGTADAHPAGTPSYLAPEAIVGLPVGVGADIYSLGCMAYELLAGRRPFEHEHESEQLLAHLDEAPTPLREVAPEVPVALAAVVDRCLAKEPEQRWADARDLEAALCESQIAAGLQTDWDDLPLPDVEPHRREALLRQMPDPTQVPTARYGRLAVALAVALLLAIVALLWPRIDPTELDEIERTVMAARSAAARAYFVYPPPDEPDLATAYRNVTLLEKRDAPGPERAAALRREFAETLTRLGDRYWDEPGGRPFAIDYYAEAIVFEPDHARASARAALTAGQLAAMQTKAATLDFTPLELLAVEPLVALAEADDAARDRKVAALARRPGVRAASLSANLDHLVGATASVSATEMPPAMGPSVNLLPEAADASSAEEGAEVGQGEAPAAPASEATDRVASQRFAARAKAALAAGRYAEAQRAFESAVANDPRNAAAHAGLAVLHFERGQHTAAARRGRRAVALAPSNAEYRMGLGDAYYKVFRYAQALAQYREALRLGHADASRAIGKVQAKMAAADPKP